MDMDSLGAVALGSFMRQIKSAVDAKVGAASRRPSSPGATMTGLFSASHTSNLEDGQKSSIDYVLPPRKTADSLFSVYWTLVHPLYRKDNRFFVLSPPRFELHVCMFHHLCSILLRHFLKEQSLLQFLPETF